MQSQQQWMVMGIICASLVQIFMAVESFPIADRITSLPGQPQFNFQQFSGYVTVDEKQQRSLFYYFVEAQTQPASKPLVLRLDGGPGCSSIGAGAFVEHGPFRPNGDSGNLVKKEYSWNREANILYLESPAEVGFSYSANASFYTNVNDTIIAQDNLIFLQNWLAKFPEYQDNDFFITGESYAGKFGDQDSVIPFFGTRTLINGLAKELGLNTTESYRAWFEGKQVGGWTQVYSKTQLSFASIRGASHTAPATQPERSLVLFKAFLAGLPLPIA
ncbi:serine carboxypeptidase-like 45 [Castanea sativa]|uniref:serine carboxypeptidase-like 45 n=1 Tax=Castanea sativa TaxID=21020 RepID=UPI003F649CED